MITNNADSYFWKEIKKLIPFFLASVAFKLGDGRKASLWHSNWGEGFLSQRFDSLYSHAVKTQGSVHQFKHTPEFEELFHSITALKPQQEFVTLQNLIDQLTLSSEPDSLVWKWTGNGVFTTKSAYQTISMGVHTSNNLKNLWSVQLPMKIKIFAWIFNQNRCLTQDNLLKRGLHLVNRCYLCCRELESTDHLSGHCCFVENLWCMYMQAFRNPPSNETFAQVYRSVQDGDRRSDLQQIALHFLFCVWKERCRRAFSEEKRSLNQLIEEIRVELELIRVIQRRRKEEKSLFMAPPGKSNEEAKERVKGSLTE